MSSAETWGEPLPRTFYDRKTKQVARDLVGAFLCRRTGRGVNAYIVTETEAYLGAHDLASHSSKGITSRTQVMYGPPGHAYIYLIYGMHYCLNVVTEREGNGAAVLIRGISPAPVSSALTDKFPKLDGPGKLTRALDIDKSLNGADITTSESLWFCARTKRPRIIAGPRIGVDYAGDWAAAPLRFCMAP